MIFQEQNRAEIRESILRGLGGYKGLATGGGDTASLIDTYGLQGNDDYHIGKYVYMTKVAGATATSKTRISDYAGSTHDATLSPVVSGNVAANDVYELYPRPYHVDDVNDVINRAIINASFKMLVQRVTDDNFTIKGRYEYDWLVPYAFGLDFKAVYKVEYVYNTQVKHTLHTCDAVWAESVDAEVTASIDSSIQREGNGCLKLVVTADAEADDLLATAEITSTDIYDCDQIEIWIYSTVALDAGDLQLLLDNTALCASALESLDLPAISANTWTRCILDLDNAPNDVDIISIGLKLVTDKGACTFYLDDIVASLSDSKEYRELTPDLWDITRGSTPKLKLTYNAYSLIGANKQVRISGYASPDIFSDDSTDSEIDPEYITEWALAYLMLYHAKSPQLDLKGQKSLGELHLATATKKLQSMSTSFAPNTRFCN